MFTAHDLESHVGHSRMRILAVLAAGCAVFAGRADVLFVKADAGGANDGSSWADAFVDLQDALLAVGEGDQVWVAAGRYVPRTGTEDDDYRLTGGSPCIDAGWNNAVPPDALDLDGDGDTTERTPFDLGGRPRFADDPNTSDSGCGAAPVVDMGAYEFDGDASAPCFGDIDGDRVVGGDDLAVLLGAFGATSDDAAWDCRADLNADLRINIVDLGMLLGAYGGDCP